MVNLCNRMKPLRSLWCHISRSYYHHNQTFPPLISNHGFKNPQIRVYSPFIQNPSFYFPSNVRFFAAPIQVKAKQEEKDSGPRLNEKIKADTVRLVTEEGHDIVSRMEALQRAAALKLDLVEVDRNSNPPVCKIMAYHTEKYKKKVKDKDRAKSKSEVTLRKGDCKEVRLSAKIQENDLQMKANAVKRLMESGYRVKCMATGVKEVAQKDKTRKQESEEARIKRIAKEQNDLREIIARLSTMIEDISVVESGPFLEKMQAYIVVRHIKFGLPKKGGSSKNASKNETNPDTQNSMDSDSSSPIKQDESADQPSPKIDDETPLEENRYKRGGLSVSTDNRYKRPEITPVIENRYKRPGNAPGVENRHKRPESPPIIENRYKSPENAPVVENRYNRANNSMPIENRYNKENNAPVAENRYNRANNAPVTENRYNRANNAPITENRYNRETNAPPSENRYSRENYAPPSDNRYNRVNNFSPSDNRYNRETNSPPTENRYRRDNEYNANAEGGRVNSHDIREQTQRQGENRYRNENNFDQTRHPRPQGGPPTPPYSGNR